MKQERISKGAFEVILGMQKADHAVGQLPKPKKSIRTASKKPSAGTAELTSPFAALSGQDPQALQKALQKRRGTLSDAYDWERDAYVADSIAASDVLVNSTGLNSAFTLLAKSRGLALYYTFSNTQVFKPRKIVVGYLYSSEYISPELGGQCLRISASQTRANICTAAKGATVSDPSAVQKEIVRIYGEAPGIGLSQGLFLMRSPLKPSAV